MGLDINILPKPKSGHEAEFEEIWHQFHGRAGPSEKTKGFWQKLWRIVSDKGSDAKSSQDLEQRFFEISVPAYEAIGAPIVGKDQEADNWFRASLKERIANGEDVNEAAEFSEMTGYFALQAMPDCDGFPIYTYAYLYEGVDRTSFRGKFLDGCDAVLDRQIINQAWEPMLAKEFGAWGLALSKAAEGFADANNLSHILNNKPLQPGPGTAEEALHIVDQAARWVNYWSSRGHGSDPFF